MKIIGNLSTKHINEIKELAENSTELVFFSPFCYQDFSDFFQEVLHSQINKITLVTTLKPDDASYKANSLVSFIDEANTRKLKWSIRIDNKLHGKMYFFFKKTNVEKAIITSANLTDNGMIRNHEWGCVVDDKQELELLYNEAISAIELNELTEDRVIKLMLAVDEYRKNHPFQKEYIEQIDINEIIKKTTGIDWNPETRIFLKPYGSTDDKIYDGDFSEETEMYFSKRRPNSVRINDLLICYAVGSTKLTSVFKVLSEPQKTDNSKDRWPWYVDVENLTPIYGKKWFETDNTLAKVQTAFLKKNKDNKLTFNGGKTLGAFQFGADKIRLDDNFGHYLLDIIEKSFV